LDVRDKRGIVQVVINPDNQDFALAETVRNEFVLKISVA
jgi:aspartyl-tRNA synthetase